MNKLGINFEIENGFISGLVKNELIGNIIDLPFPSVGATENIMMAAILAKGKTIINNAAKEPEIIDLGDCLNSMGAKIIGQGTNTINIEGVNSLHDSSYDIMFDRIVAGTYVLAGVMINKKFTVKNIKSKYLESLIQTLIKMKANLMVNDNDITILPSKKIIGINIETAPYPGFPTDLQAQIMALMCMANGPSTIKEKIFENRFMHVSELNRLGANIKIKKDTGVEISGSGDVVRKNEDNNNNNTLLLTNKSESNILTKEYKSINSYTPTGNLVYNNDLLERIKNKL